jgi:Bacteriophage minor capsid protein
MSTLSELGDYLDGLGIATQAVNGQGGTLFLSSRPDTPDDLLCLYQYPGGPPEYVQDSFSPVAESVQIQVVARAIRYEDADRLASEAWTALSSVTNATLGGTYYRSIRPNSSPGLMGRDANDRLLVFFNATVEKEVSLDPVS